MSEPVRIERPEDGGPLAELVFDNPPLNLWDDAQFAGVERALQALRDDPPRALLIRAEGKVVSGGVDVELFARVDGGDGGRELWRRCLALSTGFERLPFPTIFAAHGLCLTASFELALACDLLVASRKARFGLVERVVGLTPAMGGTQRLVERAGPARARELVYTGELFDAETLERWNVVNRVFEPETFSDDARAFALQIADGPTRAHAATKAVVRAALEGGVARADEVVVDEASALFDTDDLKRAVRSFLDEGPGRATFAGR